MKWTPNVTWKVQLTYHTHPRVLNFILDVSYDSLVFESYVNFKRSKFSCKHTFESDFKLKALMKRLPRDAIFCNEFKVHYMFIWIISSAFHTMLLFIILYKDAKAWKGLDASIEKYILQHYTEGICETMQQIANGFICAFLALPRWSCWARGFGQNWGIEGGFLNECTSQVPTFLNNLTKFATKNNDKPHQQEKSLPKVNWGLQ
jgi:hypothetical protein